MLFLISLNFLNLQFHFVNWALRVLTDRIVSLRSNFEWRNVRIYFHIGFIWLSSLFFIFDRLWFQYLLRIVRIFVLFLNDVRMFRTSINSWNPVQWQQSFKRIIFILLRLLVGLRFLKLWRHPQRVIKIFRVHKIDVFIACFTIWIHFLFFYLFFGDSHALRPRPWLIHRFSYILINHNWHFPC